jgi:hypothetical protein
MVEMNNLNSPQLIEAVQLWTGWGHCVMPSRDDKRLADHFGSEMAGKLLPIIRALEVDFYSSDARLVATNLQEMGRVASEHFKRRHPTVADEIVKVFAWCYTFDFK